MCVCECVHVCVCVCVSEVYVYLNPHIKSSMYDIEHFWFH